MNPLATAETLKIDIKGTAGVNSKANVITLAGNPGDSNTITEPTKVVPTKSTVSGLKPEFTYTMPPHSIVVITLKARQ